MKEALIAVLIVVGCCISWCRVLYSIANKKNDKPVLEVKNIKAFKYLMALVNIVLTIIVIYMVVKYIL